MSSSVGIIGGGIIGVSIAHALVSRGFDVTLFDPQGIAKGASQGNAGALAFAAISPLSAPGNWYQAPRWLLDPAGPLSIHLSGFAAVLPWFWQFYRAGRGGSNQAIEAKLTALNQRSERAFRRFQQKHTDLMGPVREVGALYVYESNRALLKAIKDFQRRSKHGVQYRVLNRSELSVFQPGLSPNFIGGIHVPGWYLVDDPKRVAERIWAHAEGLGAKLRLWPVSAVLPAQRTLFANKESQSFDHLVLATGYQAPELLAPLGRDVCVIGEAGYNTTFQRAKFTPNCLLMFAEHGFVATPLEGALRIGGASEFGRQMPPKTLKRSQHLLKKARSFLPEFKDSTGKAWMGFRPSTPDSLPIIGRDAEWPYFYHAYGHGHLGLTQSFATAEQIADEIEETED